MQHVSKNPFLDFVKPDEDAIGGSDGDDGEAEEPEMEKEGGSPGGERGNYPLGSCPLCPHRSLFPMSLSYLSSIFSHTYSRFVSLAFLVFPSIPRILA